jgi:hypothetical protein
VTPASAEVDGRAHGRRPLVSHHDCGRGWAGTDDGLIDVTSDGGKTWNDVTPPDLTPWMKVSVFDDYILDDITPLRQLTAETMRARAHPFTYESFAATLPSFTVNTSTPRRCQGFPSRIFR